MKAYGEVEVVTIGFWRWCITLRNIEFSDTVRRPGIKKQTKGKTTFRKLDLFPSSGAGKKPILLGPLEPSDWG
jgi:hypothetical protein